MISYKAARHTLVAVLVLFSFTATGYGADQLAVHKRGRRAARQSVPNEVIIKFRAGVGKVAIAAVHRRHGTKELYSSRFAGFKRIRIPKGKTVAGMVAVLRKDAAIEYAEPNTVCQAFMSPSDPLYSYQWHMDIPQGDEKVEWHGANGGGINAEPAWDESQGASVIVAVIDTGIAYEDYRNFRQAPDLAGTAFVPGYDFINNDSHPNDDDSHGTHVTGTIAQSTNNGVGVAGVAPACSIMPVKVLNANGSGTAQTVADGIYYATDNGAQVINMSLGWPVANGNAVDPGDTVRNAVAYAHGKGVVIVCASGNDGAPAVAYPAAYDDYCIAVGATRYDETRTTYSNYGNSLDIVAPGGDVSVDQNEDGYGDGVLQNTFNPNGSVRDFGYWFFDGTSMATPHVAGVAALLIAHGITGPDQVRQALQSTAEDKGGTGWDKYYGHGLLDADAALAYQDSNNAPTVSITSPADGSSHDSGAAISFAGSANDEEDGDLTTSIVWASDKDGQIGTGATVSATLSDGTHTVTASVTDSGNKTGSASITVTVVPRVGSVAGTVTDLEGTPIEGATVSTDTGQSALTGADGTYTVADVPVGERSVTASATGYESQTQTVTVAESLATPLDFSLIAAPTVNTVKVTSIDYATEGGKNGDKHLSISVTLMDNLGKPVGDASVSVSITLDGQSHVTDTGTTGADGTVSFNINNAASGTYSTRVTNVAADGLTWDGEYPANSFVK